MIYDTTPAAGTVVDDLGHGVTVVLRDPPRTEGHAWIAGYAVNCAAHGWQVSRRHADECTAEGRAHIRKDHAGEVIITRVWRDGADWQHAVDVTTAGGRYHARISDGAVSWADAHVWADPGAYGLERVTCPGHGGAVCQYGACDYIRPAGLDLAAMAAEYEASHEPATA